MTISEINQHDNLTLNGDRIQRITENAFLIEGRGWIPKSIISHADYQGTYKRSVGKAQGYDTEQQITIHRFEVEIPYWFVQQNPQWKVTKDYGF